MRAANQPDTAGESASGPGVQDKCLWREKALSGWYHGRKKQFIQISLSLSLPVVINSPLIVVLGLTSESKFGTKACEMAINGFCVRDK